MKSESNIQEHLPEARYNSPQKFDQSLIKTRICYCSMHFGLIIGLISLLSCQHPPVLSTYRETFLADIEMVADFFQNTFPEEELIALDTGWMFYGMDSLPGIHGTWPYQSVQSQPVALPHRLPFPNHSMWYKWEGILEPGILLIDADDGAQCKINGKRVLRSHLGDFYPQDDNGKCTVEIRVMNNAMAGGLRKVRLLPKAALAQWETRKTEIRQKVLERRKLELLQDMGLRSELEGLEETERALRLSAYPILFTVPQMILGTDGKRFLRWVSESSDPATLHLDDGETLTANASDGVFTVPIPPATDIYFELHQGRSHQGRYTFSASNYSEGVRIALWGDSQGGWETFREIADAIREHQPDISIGAGDLVNNGSEELAYPRFLQLLSRMQTTQLLVPGNHDYDGYYDDLFAKQMNDFLFRPETSTYGLLSLGDVSVITLDPNENFPVSVPEATHQRNWLEEQMASPAWKNSKWKVIVVHQPPYSQGWPGYHGEWTIRHLIEPYLHQGLIDLVVAGHTHDYERLSLQFSGHPVHFLVVGGAGGGLEPADAQSDYPKMDRIIKKHHFGILEANSSQMNFIAYDLDGKVIDELKITK
nr:hypothetical protein [Cytophagales bacterium]